MTSIEMRAAVYTALGSARDVLVVERVPVPEPGPGEVRVRMRLSGVNPSDVRARVAGRGVPLVRQIPHSDGVGFVDAVGSGVGGDRVGERVWTWNAAWMRESGTAAQWVCLPADQAVVVPHGVSDDLAAGIGIPFMTAWHALTLGGPIAGRTVLVAGGAGAVGNAAVQLAARAGARVVATASTPDKAALARRAGADLVVDYREAAAADAVRALVPDGVDLIVELAPGRNMDLNMAVVADHGTIAVYAPEPEPPIFPVQRLMRANIAVKFLLVYTIGKRAQQTAIAGISAALADGAVTALPTHHFELDDIAAAHEAVENGTLGKVVVTLPGEMP